MVAALLWPLNATLQKHLNNPGNLTVEQLLDGCGTQTVEQFSNSEELVADGVSQKGVPACGVTEFDFSLCLQDILLEMLCEELQGPYAKLQEFANAPGFPRRHYMRQLLPFLQANMPVTGDPRTTKLNVAKLRIQMSKEDAMHFCRRGRPNTGRRLYAEMTYAQVFLDVLVQTAQSCALVSEVVTPFCESLV